MYFYDPAREKTCAICGATFWTFAPKDKWCGRCCEAVSRKARRTRNKKREQAGQMRLFSANNATDID